MFSNENNDGRLSYSINDIICHTIKRRREKKNTFKSLLPILVTRFSQHIYNIYFMLYKFLQFDFLAVPIRFKYTVLALSLRFVRFLVNSLNLSIPLN